MTVEVGILNKHGIALAADSAVTIGDGNKFYNTANKLFALSKFNPVAIMIYSNADIMGYPVETLVKEYRKKLKDENFATLKEYWDSFVNYLLQLFGQENNKKFFLYQINSFLMTVDHIIKDEMNNLINTLEGEEKETIQEELIKLINHIINCFHEEYYNMEDDPEFKDVEIEIKSECYEEIKSLIEEIIGILDKDTTEKLIETCIMILTKHNDRGNRTGIVIAGFGDDELYPSLINGEFLGIFFGRIKYNIKKDVQITNEMNAIIIPFAQDDVINTFMNGIDGRMYNEILLTIDGCKEDIQQLASCSCNVDGCIDKLKQDIINKMDDISLKYQWGPIIDTVGVAPKEELAQMAETLVNLTSFRRKLTMDTHSQSVGGPIDVALITKGDGFIWIKRKHYFDRELNYNFFQNYYK